MWIEKDINQGSTSSLFHLFFQFFVRNQASSSQCEGIMRRIRLSTNWLRSTTKKEFLYAYIKGKPKITHCTVKKIFIIYEAPTMYYGAKNHLFLILTLGGLNISIYNWKKQAYKVSCQKLHCWFTYQSCYHRHSTYLSFNWNNILYL